MKIVISEIMDAPAVAALGAKFDVVYDDRLVDDPGRLAQLLSDADAWIVRNRTQVRGELLAAARKLRVVGRLGVGLDNIDLAACKARGIEVIPATGANALAVAEYVVGTAMLLLRGAYASRDAIAAGKWPRNALGQGRETAGKTLGIVGFGSIGRLTGRLARAVGMTTIACDPQIAGDAGVWAEENTASRSLDALLGESDVVTLHVPLVDQTRNLFDAARFARMRPGSILIDTARGGIVDERALAAALLSGHLGGAAIDVFADEPLPAGSLWADPRLAGLNLVLTPHIAGVTREANDRVSTLIAGAVAEFLAR
jgi:(S)-sulfolactate dehydrogenase